jgi:hypothetical protein
MCPSKAALVSRLEAGGDEGVWGDASAVLGWGG